MKNNAIKFNGEASPIAQEAIAIFNFVKDQVASSRPEFEALEAAVEDQYGGNKQTKGRKKKTKKAQAKSASAGGVNVGLGDLRSSTMGLDDIDSDDSDESFSGLLME